jgi:hypothetical protein
MSDAEVDTSQTVVQTYVPAYQRQAWDEHAEELGMSRSEFVRTMVQAGRRGFGADPGRDSESNSGTGEGPIGVTEDALRTRVVESIEQEGCLGWEELLAEVTGDIESRLERTLDELQNDGQIRHSGRQGGYVLDTDR